MTPNRGAAKASSITAAAGLLACGAIAGPLFTVVWVLEGATRAGYSPLRHPVSSLELGDFDWTQVANFIVAGTWVPSACERSMSCPRPC